jgi:hypothetical protein
MSQPFSDCWLWNGAQIEGYGIIRHYPSKKAFRVHRLIWQTLRGPIPKGLELDHLCRNTLCVRPDHLEAVTHRVNLLRGKSPSALNAKKINCPNGHPYDGKDGLRRYCKTCRRNWHRKYFHKNKQMLLARQKTYPRKPMTEEQKERKRLRLKEYYAKNREWLKERAREACRKSKGADGR